MSIEVYFPGNKKVNALVNGHEILTDQVREAGGEGSASEPFTLFLASLATCAGIYVKSFCDQRGIPAENIRLYQDQEYNPIAKMIGKIRIRIVVPPDFPEKYDQAVIHAAGICAVKRHLSEKITHEIVVERR
jgi:ribosomal protein S12 methylthiotransferase accessory factor